MATRVCRVVPDVAAVDRAFDYSVPDDLADLVRVGSVVRVPLHGRRVRGWVVADGVTAETAGERLLALLAVVSEGPPGDVVDLAAWVAHRYAGSRVALLRSASPPNRVTPRDVGGGDGSHRPDPASRVEVLGADDPVRGAAGAAAVQAVEQARGRALSVVRWPPLLDRRALVSGLLARSGSTLVVTADGARASGLVSWLRRSGFAAVLMRGDDPAAARTAAWESAARGAVIVVGGRVAALAPVPDLAAAILVDDGDEALKEERVPAWHAREVLAERAARAGARLTIVSPAPTPESLALAGPVIDVPRGVEVQGWPRVDVVDRTEEPPGAGLFSEHLAGAIHRCVDEGSPAVCVLNRRGRARLLACGRCGRLVRRDLRGAPVWDLAQDGPPGGAAEVGGEDSGRVCPGCGAIALRVLRAGVTRVREELSALLPRVEVAEVEASTGEVPQAAVLVGTEAVLHRAEVRRRHPGLVAYLDFDQELLAARFRAGEQALWLLVRGAHMLAGGPRDATRLLVQTRLPSHPVIEAALHADTARFAEAELSMRAAAQLPPCTALAELSGAAEAVASAAAGLRAPEIEARGVTVLGPTVSATSSRALVRARDAQSLAGALAAVLPAARACGRLRCEVDPLRV